MTPYECAWETMRPFLDRLSNKPGVAGVAVLCNAALPAERTHFDIHSDFDIALLISVPDLTPERWSPIIGQVCAAAQAQLPRWLPNFAFRVPCPHGPLVVNVNQLVLEHERDPRTEWDMDKCDVYAYKSRMVYDPAGCFQGLIADKTAAARKHFPRLIRRLAFRLTWDVRLVPLLAAQRSNSIVGHYLVNNAIEEFIELVFLLQGRFVAARKWRLLSLAEFDLLPHEDYALLQSIVVAHGDSAGDLERRVSGLCALWESLRERFCLPSTDEIQRHHLSTDVQLLRRTAADAARASAGDSDYDLANFEMREAPLAVSDPLPPDGAPLSSWIDECVLAY